MRAFLPHPLSERLDSANLSTWNPQPLLSERMTTMWDPNGLIEDYYKALQQHGYDPAVDYVVLTGKAVYIAFMFLAVWRYLEATFPDDNGFPIIMYDASLSKYKESRISRAPITE